MLSFSHTRAHARSQAGFTLIELLVVILILGILVGVAIPTFLSQTDKASDSNLQSVLGTAHVTEATYRVGNGGYTTSASALETVEPSLTTPFTSYGMSVTQWAPSGTTPSATTGYEISGTDAKSGATFNLFYNANTGAVLRTCSPQGIGACGAGGTWGS